MNSGSAKTLPVVYAAAALSEPVEIWKWNEDSYDRQHAFDYIEFLIDRIENLGKHPQIGRAVGTHPELRYLPIKAKNRGHGHVAVYSVGQHAVNILHIFHTSRNWQSELDVTKHDS